ncbi:hypothetical protein ACWA7J_12435 [Leptothrix sp. BB-4]
MSSSAYTIRVIRGGMTVSRLTVSPQAGARGEAVVLSVRDGASVQLALSATNLGPPKIRTRREGVDLWINLDGQLSEQPDVVIRGYYALAQLPALQGLDASGDVQTYRLADVSPLVSLQGFAIGDTPPVDDALYLGGRPADTLIDGLSDNTLMWAGAALGAHGVYQSVWGGSSGPASSPLDPVKAYADNGLSATAAPAPAPTLSTYEKAGVKGVTRANLDAINSSVLALDSADVDSAAKVQTVVDAYVRVLGKANGPNVGDTTADRPLTATEFRSLGVNLKSLESTDVDLKLLGDVLGNRAASEVDSVTKLNGLVLAVEKVMNTIGGSTLASPLAAADFVSLGVNNVTSANLEMIKSVLAEGGKTSAPVRDVARLSAIVSSCDKVLNYANGATADDPSNAPTAQNYADLNASIGLAAKATAGGAALADHALKLLDDVVGRRSSTGTTGVDTVKKINDLAAAVDHVMKLASGASGVQLTSSDLSLLGITAAVHEQAALSRYQTLWANIAKTDDLGVDVDTVDELRTLVTAALGTMGPAEALTALRSFADGSGSAPIKSTYEAAGVVGVTLVNVGAVNSAISALASTDLPQLSSVQKVVDLYEKVRIAADGPTPTDTSLSLTADDYRNLGVSLGALELVSTTQVNRAIGLLDDIVSRQWFDSVDSVSELNTLVADVAKVQGLVSAGNTLFWSDLTTMGVTAPTSYTGDTSGVLMSALRTSLDVVARSDTPITSLADLQTLVTGYAKVLQYANGTAVNSNFDAPSAQDYARMRASIGMAKDGRLDSLSALADNALQLLDDVVGQKSSTSSDPLSVGRIQDIATAVDHVMLLAKADSFAAIPAAERLLTDKDLSLLLGSDVVTTSMSASPTKFQNVFTAIAAIDNVGLGINSYAELKTLYVNAPL